MSPGAARSASSPPTSPSTSRSRSRPPAQPRATTSSGTEGPSTSPAPGPGTGRSPTSTPAFRATTRGRAGCSTTRPDGRTRRGGAAGFAIVDSEHFGRGHVQNTFLTSRTLDLTGRTAPTVEFAQDLHPAVNSTATVDLSVDGGRTWATVWNDAGFPGSPGPHRQVVPLPQASGKATVKIRFHYLGQWSGWWAIDDVFIGSRTCAPVPGALLTGQVTDAGTRDGLVGAAITGEPGLKATTTATPDDPALDDGIYWLFSPATGQRRFTAALDGYTPSTRPVDLAPKQATRLDFVLTSAP
uniref:carboxypeptidase regulatory-like domain-containing protein n=1 Tax=Actinomadura sp. CA-154981 TaxID=3240037 RepID=UPI003F4923CF